MPQKPPAWFYAILLFVSSRGRIGRSRYWIGVLSLILWSAFVLYLARNSLGQLGPSLATAGLVGLPAYCVLAKRLHDLGRTARAAALPGVLVAALLIYRLALPSGLWLSWLLAASAAMALFMLIGLGVARGQGVDNRFGHVPGQEVERLARVFD